MLEWIKREYLVKEDIRNVLTLMTGTVFSQLILLVISPVLTRLFTPEDFGLLALYTSTAALFTVIATGRYELAIILPKEERHARDLVYLSFLIALLVGLVSLLGVGLFNRLIVRILKNESFSFWLYLIPLTIVFTGIFQALNYWSTRRKEYKKLALVKIIQSLITSVLTIVTGLALDGPGGLIWGVVGGQVLAALLLYHYVWSGKRDLPSDISLKSLGIQARIYQSFPKINSLHAFLNILQTSLVVFIISKYYNSTILGYYALSIRILHTPLNFIGSSITQVFYQKAAEMVNQGFTLRNLVIKTTLKLAAITLPLFVGLIIFAPPLFRIVFGEAWLEAGYYTQLLAPWLFFSLLFAPLSQIPLLVNRQNQYFIIGLVYNLLILSIFLFTGLYGKDIHFGLIILSVSVSLYLLILFFWIIKISSRIVEYK